MIFKTWEIVVMFIATEFLIYAFLIDVLKTIRHCVTAKCSSGSTLPYTDFENVVVENSENKEGKKDGNK